ncbi:MAG: beta-lactamase family protein, partial [Parvularculaceae bacterium]|nr:beta-lactamase family protein [Parvularculaceae bacterium]
MRLSLVAVAAAMTAFPADASDRTDLDRGLAALAAKGAGGSGPLAGVALAVAMDGRLIYKGAAGCAQFSADGACRVPMRAETKFRVASVSKFVAAEAAMALAREGKIDLDRDVSDYLGFRFRNPAYPDDPITARQLMAHVSSLRDPEEYWATAPDAFAPILARPDLFAPAEAGASKAPGQFFKYANINYGVLAAVMEKATGERFDAIARKQVLAPLKLDAGFNWSGVSMKARRQGATLYRIENGAWKAQTDDDEMLNDTLPAFRKQDGLDSAAYLAAYRPGDNPTLFSPQGGLRASVLDLAALGARLQRDPSRAAPLWRYDAKANNGDAERGMYEAFGAGVQTVVGTPDFLDGARLEGHFGEAFGLQSGLFVVRADAARGRDKDVVVAWAITG